MIRKFSVCERKKRKIGTRTSGQMSRMWKTQTATCDVEGNGVCVMWDPSAVAVASLRAVFPWRSMRVL